MINKGGNFKKTINYPKKICLDRPVHKYVDNSFRLWENMVKPVEKILKTCGEL